MDNQPQKFFVHLSGLLSHARLQKGFATLRELYRDKKPTIDYQTWLHAESGRRVPASEIVLTIGEILDIDKEELIIAYCKDKFNDEKVHQVLESMQHKKFINMDTLVQARDYDRSIDYVLNTEQVKAMQEDINLRLYLMYTYDKELKTTVTRLANFFSVKNSEAKAIVDKLQALKLVEVIGEDVKKIYSNTRLPVSPEIFDLRKKLLIKDLDINTKPDSYIANFHVSMTEKSYKKILSLFDFVEANLIKIAREEIADPNSLRFQVVITGNKINEGSVNDGASEPVNR